MKAVYLEGPKNIFIKDVEEPKPKPGKAIIKINMCGICGSDIAAYMGTSPVVKYPVIIGHEAIGEIVQIDEDNPAGLKVGDRVVCEPVTFCGKCYPCRVGRRNNCSDLRTCGVHRPGMMVELFQHDVELLHKVPDTITDEQACMIEPLTIGLHATHRVNIQEGEVCVITGAGTIGLVCALSAMAYGAVPIVLDPVDARLEIAREMGIEYVCNNVKSDAIGYIKEINGGELPPVLYECSGATPVVSKFYEHVSGCGRVAFVGWPHENMEMDMSQFLRKELDVFGSRNSVNCFGESIELISSGKVKVDRFISNITHFEDIKTIMDDLISNPSKYLKVLIKMN